MAATKKAFAIIPVLFCTFCVFIAGAHAATYYVSGAAGNDSNPGTLESPWKTTHKANQTLQAGDTVYIRAGTYSITGSGIDPANTGTSGSPITYSNYNDEEVEFVGASDTCFAVNLNSDYGTVRSYIIVKGLTFMNFFKHMWILKGSHNEIAYCKFQGIYPRADGVTAWRGSTIYRNSQYNHVHHCTFSAYGNFYNDNDNGLVFELGNENVDNDDTAYNLIEYNHFYHGGHHVMGIGGNHNVVRNNYFHNENWWSDGGETYGNRILFFGGLLPANQRNLFENNRVAFGGETSEPDQIGGAGGTLATSNNIIRGNMFYHTLLYALVFRVYPNMYSSYNHVYNNVFYHNGYTTTEKENMSSEYTHAIYFGIGNDSYYTYIHDNCLKNNIFYDNKNQNDPTKPIVRFGQFWAHYTLENQTIENNWEEAGDPKFVNIPGTLDEMDDTLPNFNLTSSSPCIDNGGFLTVITSSNGSGTQFVVDDAGYFMNGWGIIDGDTIQIEGQTQTAQITNVDYDTNTITVDTSLTWTQGQGISLAYEGSAPDIGAYEFIQESAPVRSGGSPTGILPSGTTSTTLSLITNENATCRYSTTAGVSYSSMTDTFSTTGGTSHSTTISGLSDGDSYSYCVRCQDDWGNVNTSDYGISFSVAVPDFEPPTIPGNLQATSISSSQINLTWTASTDDVGVTGYKIYRDELEVDTSPTNSYSDTGLSPSSTYTYTVSAYDAEGNESNQSSPASATTPAAPAFIEAQSGTITSPMQMVSDAEASGGAYIQTIQTDSGTAAYAFNIDESGSYKIIARVYAPDGGSDSFYVKIDDGEEFIWHLNPSGNPDEFNVWREDEVNNQGTGTWDNPQYDPYTIELTQGTHTITFRGRETNCRLDYFYFSKVEGLSAPKDLTITN